MGSEQKIVAGDAEPYRHLLTVSDFLTLDEAGAFAGLEHVELIEGEIFSMAPLHHPHARTLMVLSTAIDLAVESLGDSWQAVSSMSAQLEPNSLPEADIIIAADPERRLLTLASVRVLVEVSSSTLAYDLGPKLRLYARAGVPELWVADVEGRRILRFHVPAGEAYAERTEFAFGQSVPSATIPGLTVDTARLA